VEPQRQEAFLQKALRSATECAAILDVCRHLKLADQEHLDSGRDFLLRVVSMLTRMTKESGTGTGTTEQDHHRTQPLNSNR
jgi:hypothetical protein